jgi:hypothetical protein
LSLRVWRSGALHVSFGTALHFSVGVYSCLEAKGRVTEEVLAGRRTLLEAAEVFRECDAISKGDGNEAWADVYRPAADEEEACRIVIRWASRAAQRDPRLQAVVVRLEEELRQALHSGATGGPSSH